MQLNVLVMIFGYKCVVPFCNRLAMTAKARLFLSQKSFHNSDLLIHIKPPTHREKYCVARYTL